jgi:ABC-2 type transport system permease protein
LTKVLTVAAWEYLERLKSRFFLISLFLMPVIMFSLGLLPFVLLPDESDGPKVVAIADMTGNLLPRLAAELEGRGRGDGTPSLVVRPMAAAPSADEDTIRALGDQLVIDGEVQVFCLLRRNDRGGFEIEFRSTTLTDQVEREALENALRSVLLEDVLTSLGVPGSTLDWLDSAVGVRMVLLSSRGEGIEENTLERFLQVFFSAYIFLMMLFFMILSSGQLLVRSVVEEKANRIVEILVSSCSPTQLMAGKILGLSGLGLTQMLVWGAVAFVVSQVIGFDFAPPDQLLLLCAYFLLGYFLYASIFVAAGSPVTTEHEAQQVTGYLVVFLVIPLVLTVPAIQNPGAEWITILSYIPLLTPTMMGLRLSLGTPSTAEIVVTMLIMIIAIYLCMIVAGRIFRVGILSMGKRPGIREIISWVREG